MIEPLLGLNQYLSQNYPSNLNIRKTFQNLNEELEKGYKTLASLKNYKVYISITFDFSVFSLPFLSLYLCISTYIYIYILILFFCFCRMKVYH